MQRDADAAQRRSGAPPRTAHRAHRRTQTETRATVRTSAIGTCKQGPLPSKAIIARLPAPISAVAGVLRMSLSALQASKRTTTSHDGRVVRVMMSLHPPVAATGAEHPSVVQDLNLLTARQFPRFRVRSVRRGRISEDDHVSGFRFCKGYHPFHCSIFIWARGA